MGGIRFSCGGFSLFTVVKGTILVLMVGAAFNVAYATLQPTSGYVQYSITIGGQSGSAVPRTITLNESAQPTAQSGFVAITLALSSSALNFSYSKDVNSSSLPEIFPYLSGLVNQSFTYQVRGILIGANITNTGGIQVTFDGESYQATNYHVSLSAADSTSGKSVSASGSVVTMPSGLVYSVQFLINGTTSVNVQLLSTNLNLTDPPNNVNPLGALMVVAAIIVAIALAVPAILKRVNRNLTNPASTNETNGQQQSNDEQGSDSEKKPSYWVD